MSQSKLETNDSYNLIKVLGAIPADDWCRNWPVNRTDILRQTCKSVKDTVDKIRPPTSAILTFDNNDNFEDYHNRTIAEKIGIALKKLYTLSIRCNIIHLDLVHCNIRRPIAFQLLGKLLENCERLINLNLSKNRLGDNGLQVIAPKLIHCPALEYIDLDLNNIGPAGIETLTGVLANFKKLSRIVLNRNQLGNAGADSFANVISECPMISSIELSHNSIGPAGLLLVTQNLIFLYKFI
jgi:hypothetical protein